MKIILTLFLMLISLLSSGQFRIQGKVIDGESLKPLEAASIFLSNTTKGTITNNKGEFQLDHLNIGKYELVVTSLDYEDYIVPVLVGQINEPIVIDLKPIVKVLKEVVIESYDENGWDQWGESFKSYLIGSTQLAKNCLLLNPEVIKFKFSSSVNKLRAFAHEKLIFENNDLGYRIKYVLSKFEIDFNSNTFSYKGYPLFEEMKAKNLKEIAKWNQKRNEVYKGSLRHFIRSLYYDQLVKDGFEIRKIRAITTEEAARVKNVLKQLHDQEDNKVTNHSTANKDSMVYYSNVRNLGVDEHMVTLNNILSRDSLTNNSLDLKSKTVYFNDYLQVLYLKKRIPIEYSKTLPAYRKNEYIRSEINLRFNNPISIYPNGNYYNGFDLLIEGYWAWSEKISTMLPSDFAQNN